MQVSRCQLAVQAEMLPAETQCQLHQAGNNPGASCSFHSMLSSAAVVVTIFHVCLLLWSLLLLHSPPENTGMLTAFCQIAPQAEVEHATVQIIFMLCHQQPCNCNCCHFLAGVTLVQCSSGDRGSSKMLIELKLHRKTLTGNSKMLIKLKSYKKTLRGKLKIVIELKLHVNTE